MAQNTHIQWTDHSANFWWGCMKVSPGCAHCYAEGDAKRYGRNVFGPAATTERWRTKGPWKDILKWDAAAKADGVRRRVFTQSMSDTFEDHPQLDLWRAEALDILERLEWLDVQLLTKRPENVPFMVPERWMHHHWPEHIWIGTSVENQAMADKRIPELLKIPARVRFLSAEPLLGPVDLFRVQYEGGLSEIDALHGTCGVIRPHLGSCNKVNWVIVGGESGPRARRMEIEWARTLVAECQEAGVAVFVKQLGSVLAREMGMKHSKGGDIAEWPEDLRVRQFPASAVDGMGALADHWPPMPDLQGGVDLFGKYPVGGGVNLAPVE